MIVELDGANVGSVEDFHTEISELLDLGPYYGRNLDALWDRISTDVERPLKLRWTNASLSRQALGDDFAKIIGVLERVEESDRQMGFADRFQLELVD